MTDKAIIKALECCLDEALEKCNECPYSVDTFMCKRMELLEDSLDLINRQQEQLEAAIAGQETLQKALDKEIKNREIQAERLREERGQKYEQIDLICRLRNELAEKDREVSVLNSDLKLLRNDYDYLKKKLDETIERNKRLRDKVVRLTAEKDSLIKTFGECQAEATKALVDKDKEIERLKNNISAMAVTMRNCAKATRAEAIKEFAERLKQRCSANSDINYYILKKLVDNLVKEMVGNAE